MGIQADWVGKTPEEYRGEKEYTFTFTLKGSISVCAKNLTRAFEKAEELSNIDLLSYVDEKEIEQE